MASPYPWHFDLRWGFYHLWPSLRAHVALPRQPRAHRFAPRTDSARVVMFGDLMGLTGDRVPTCAPALQAIFASADLVIGNCEAPITRTHNDAQARYLARLSLGDQYLRDFFDRFHVDPARCVLSVANNHAGDHGTRGLADTEARLAALGVAVAGACGGRPAPLLVREVAGLRIGVLAWTEWLNCPSDGVAGADAVDGVDWRARRAQLGLDTMLASPHWEWEFQHVPHRPTVARAHRLARAGIDAIAGHHPHVLQPLEWIDGGGATPTVCAYSLGNLFARTLTWPHRLGAVLELEIATAGPRRGRVSAYRLHPIVQLGSARDAHVVPLAEAPTALRARITERLALLFPDPAAPAGPQAHRANG